ncbi:MAG TPA: hypothetical protein VHX43_12860 [Xanthobacteraceae bacterium]|jgi:hypothetical protein|nr:hypothetical protein [Xanthobacteraceae bacterium]
MFTRIATLLLVLGLAAAASAQTAPVNWPPLPTKGFVSGRPATDEDVAAGNAIFVLKAYGTYFSKPMDIVIPQYAYMTKAGQKTVPVIVVQAEIGKGIKLFGVRGLDGDKSTARDFELKLLGTKPPN